ncbi:hypothetical protein [Paenibacillus sp. L3-i20]|nr:hypothetical protein L3i20_v231470 [Paenibacillus sp. L3-i20]
MAEKFKIDSELIWLDALNEKGDTTLPKGILDRNGSRTVISLF